MLPRFPGALRAYRPDAGLMFLRLSASFMLLYVHGWPKLADYAAELGRIEDPFGLGATVSLGAAIFAEVVCPVFIVTGLFTRAATLPILAVLLIAMIVVHPDWSIAEGQFGWLLLIAFTTIGLCGPGTWSFDARIAGRKGGG